MHNPAFRKEERAEMESKRFLFEEVRAVMHIISTLIRDNLIIWPNLDSGDDGKYGLQLSNSVFSKNWITVKEYKFLGNKELSARWISSNRIV